MSLKIDSIDKRILFELDKNSRIPETKLARILGKSKESIRYRIKKLTEKKIINKFTIWIDPTKIAYQVYKIYLLTNNIPEKKKELIEYVKNDKRLFWLGVAEGVWNIGLTFFSKNAQEFFELKNQLMGKFKELIIELKTAQVVEIQIHEKTFLYNTNSKWTHFFNDTKKEELDNVSRILLNELFNNSRINLAKIAHKYKTTVDIIRNRIRKMEKQKIIVKYTININYDLLNYEFYKTFLYLKNTDKESINKILSYILESKKIIHLVKQISPWDIELETVCENYKEYVKIMSKLTQKFTASIHKIETAIISEDYVFPSKEKIFQK